MIGAPEVVLVRGQVIVENDELVRDTQSGKVAEIKPGGAPAAGPICRQIPSQFGSVADLGFGGNAGFVLVPRSSSKAMTSALSSAASGGT